MHGEPNQARTNSGHGEQEAQNLLETALIRVRDALDGLRFGSIALTIHEGRVVQIDVTEKKRLMPG